MMCKKPVEKRNTICDDCTILNEQRRNFHVNLKGYTALVTGARIKIGYSVALRLLRDGAYVIALTRFPYDALRRYSKEKDFEVFKDRLTIYGADLRQIHKLDMLLDYLYENFRSIEILINNAAQTIKKPLSFYNELIKNENQLKLLDTINKDKVLIIDNKHYIGSQLLTDTQNTDLYQYKQEDTMYNSWVAKPDEISIEEFLEVQLINVTSPFILTSRLKNLLKMSDKKNKFVINVSSVEGRFSQASKLSRHTHTNMAKASLNMLTSSIAKEYSKDRIFVYSVDPGWVSNQFPQEYEVSKNFQPYLTFEDGATRICDPIYRLLLEQNISKTGCFIKDFATIEY